MNRLHGHGRSRVAALVVSLVLFLVGSNYCLLSAWGGNVRMACLTLPTAPVAPRCEHCAPAAKHGAGGSDRAKRSCCPDPVIAPPALSLERPAAAPAPGFAALVADAAPALAPPALAGHRPPALADGRPPTRLSSAPSPARAPPLA